MLQIQSNINGWRSEDRRYKVKSEIKCKKPARRQRYEFNTNVNSARLKLAATSATATATSTSGAS